MKKLFIALLFSASAFAAPEPDAIQLECTFRKDRVDYSVNNVRFDTVEETEVFTALPLTHISREFEGYTLSAFVCNSNPISEIDLLIRDSKDRHIGQTISRVNDEYFSHSTAIFLDENNALELSVSCRKKQ